MLIAYRAGTRAVSLDPEDSESAFYQQQESKAGLDGRGQDRPSAPKPEVIT